MVLQLKLSGGLAVRQPAHGLARLGWQDGGWGSGRAGLPPEEFLGARSPASTHWGTWGTWGPAIT